MAGNLKYRIDTVISEEMRDGIEKICEINIIRPSVYLRQLIVRNLIEQGIFEKPTIKSFNNNSAPKEINGGENEIGASAA
jgi:hypothetical protein